MAPPKGFKLTKEQREKISLATRGKPKSLEMRTKLSAAKLGVPRGPMSEEQKQKISRANKGHSTSDEQRRKISEAKKGKTRGPLPKEWRENIGKSLIGKMGGSKNPNYGKRGKESHAWKGGISYEPYCPKFNKEFKERVRAFFNHSCVLCGRDNSKDVHHVDYNKEACCDQTPPIFILLCRHCHMKTNYNREYWQEQFTKLINEKYSGKCYFSKEEYDALMED